jgi:TrmH family RNA methyltransferase
VFEGPELLRAALDASIDLDRVYVAPVASDEVLAAAQRAKEEGVEVFGLATGVLERVADAASPQGCIAVARRQFIPLGELDQLSLVLVVDQVQDPGNLGAIIRVAEGCGADAVVVTGAGADPFGPKALRASAGSTFRVPIVEATEALELIAALERLELEVCATSSHQGEDFAFFDWGRPLALVFGNEGSGLSEQILARCGSRLRIPLEGCLESLNVSVAAGILAMSARRRLQSTEADQSASTMSVVESEDRP